MVFGKKKEAPPAEELMFWAMVKREATIDLSTGRDEINVGLLISMTPTELERVLAQINDNGLIEISLVERKDGKAADHNKH